MLAAPAGSETSNAIRVGRCVEAPDQTQLQRFELKYLVSELAARAMQRFVRCHLMPDEFARKSPEHSYAVHTLYLDSPDLCLCWATEDGDKNRFKLRIRFYRNGADAPAQDPKGASSTNARKRAETGQDFQTRLHRSQVAI